MTSDRFTATPLIRRGIWIGAYSPPSPWESMATVHELERAIGRRLDVVHIYKAWGETWGQYNAETMQELVSATTDGRRALITWEPWFLSSGSSQSNFSLASITAGEHDGYIKSWAEGIRELPSIVYLRPMHEMNGNWYPWAGDKENMPIDYISAWRHMYKIFDQMGTGNVRWVWSPYAVDTLVSNGFEAYYPGDEYVDILALDAYNWGSPGSHPAAQNAGRWQEADDLLSNPYHRLIRVGPQPVWLTEIASAEQGGDKANWLRTFLNLRGYSRVSAIIWFDVDKERDWRIASSAEAVATVALALAGNHPADELEVAPPRPLAVFALGIQHAALVKWRSADDVKHVSYEVLTYAAGDLVRRDVTRSTTSYVVPRLNPGTPYTFAVRTLSRFGRSSSSGETPQVTVIE